MTDITSWQVALIESWREVWLSFLSGVPMVLGAILIFAVGLVLAYWVKRLVIELLQVIRLEKVSKSLGVEQYLEKADIKKSLTELLGTLAEWLIILVFFLAAVDILGLDAISTVLGQVLEYVPNIFAAALILGVGYFVAGLADGVVRGALASIDSKIARPLGKLSRWLLIVITFFAAVDQLQIAQTLIATFFQGLTYTIVLVVGLSVGLGAKDLVSRVLNDWYDKISK